MPDTLLIIDGRGRPDALIQALEAAGYFCVYARGPLKARAALREFPVVLIVWKDNTGNAGLSKDLAGVWRGHPRIPVLHLVGHAGRTAAAELGPQVRARLPVEAGAARLLAAVGNALSVRRSAARSELDFLGAATARGAPKGAGPARARLSAIGVHAPAAAVSLDERRSLSGPPEVSTAGLPGLFDRVRTRLSGLRARRPADG